MSDMQFISDQLAAIQREQTAQGKLLATVEERTIGMKERLEDAEESIESLSTWRTQLTTRISMIALAIGAFSSFITDWVRDHFMAGGSHS